MDEADGRRQRGAERPTRSATDRTLRGPSARSIHPDRAELRSRHVGEDQLGAIVANEALDSPAFSEELIEQVNFDNTNYVTSDQLAAVLEEKGASASEIDAALEIFEDARLRALRTTLMFLAALALLALVPAGKMPDFREPDLTAEDEEGLTLATPRPGR